MKKYVIGVDGGNTKTDYLLYDIEGNFVDGVRCGTCSHESPKIGSFNGAYIEMNNQITNLLERNNLTIEDVESGAFGLAGVDAPFQKKALEEAVEKIGFKNYQVVNDGFLGIKAASPTGTGVCSINGTGTVNVGIDEDGKWMQVGGIGYVAGDEGGGSFLARAAVRIAFDEAFRFGPKTKVTEDVFKMYDIESKKEFSDAIVGKRIDSTYLIKSLFNRANEGDAPAIKVLETAGENMGRSTAGVIAETLVVVVAAVSVVVTVADVVEGFVVPSVLLSLLGFAIALLKETLIEGSSLSADEPFIPDVVTVLVAAV